MVSSYSIQILSSLSKKDTQMGAASVKSDPSSNFASWRKQLSLCITIFFWEWTTFIYNQPLQIYLITTNLDIKIYQITFQHWEMGKT